MKTEKTYFIDKFRPYQYKMIWQINNSCNFKCEYCFNNGMFDPIKQPTYSIDLITSAYDKTNINWLIVISGGEPFLYPNFIELLKELTKKHTVAFSSNFSSNNLYRLNEIHDKSKILLVNASYHYEYRKKIKNGIPDFIDKVLYLQSIGIEVLVSHVNYPPFTENIPIQFKFLQEIGIKKLSALTFRSIYNGNKYPLSYNDSEIAIIDKYSIDLTESEIVRSKTNFYQQYCEAGMLFYFMNEAGDVRRCGSINKKFGNLFEGSFNIGNQLKPCTVKDCIDCYLGFLSVKEKKANIIQTFFEKKNESKW